MTSILSETQALTRSNGTFVVVAAADNAISSAFSSTAAIATAGFINSAGSVYNYGPSGSDTGAERAVAAIENSMTTGVSAVVGALYQDKGNRIVFSSNGQTVAIFAEVLPLNNLSTEGGETTFYICIWSANPQDELYVRVARI